MLCFVFSALAVLLDQLFKRWTVMAIAGGEDITIIPKVIGLTYIENTGAAFGIFSTMRWPLAALSFICCIVLIMILLRYDAGFWGRLGLAAVLGGAAGNMCDRIFRGYVVDMFEFLFFDFAIFNVADCFIILGGITFIIYFLSASVKEGREQKVPEHEISGNMGPRVLPSEHVRRPGPVSEAPFAKKQDDPPPFAKSNAQQPTAHRTEEDFSLPDTEDYSEFIEGLSETSILEEFDIDRLMSEYGIDEEKD